MKTNTSKERSFYTQGQRFAARILFILWLLASFSPESVLAIPKRQMTPAPTTSPGDPSLASTPPTPLPGGILQLPLDSPGSFWGNSVASSPAIDAALQERMSQEVAPFRERDLLRTSPKVSPVSENFSFQARGGENVRFHYQMGQWRAEVSSHVGDFSRRAVLPIVCSQGEDIASSLEVLSRHPRWYSQRQIHVLDRNVCPTLGEVVYVGELGLKGGNDEGEASGSGEQRGELPRGGPGSHQVESHQIDIESLSSLSAASSLHDRALSDFSELADQVASQVASSAIDSGRQIPTSAQPLTNQDESPVDRLKDLAPDPQLDQQPDKLAELGAVLLKLATSKQSEEAGTSHQDLSPYTDAAIHYQHVLSICEQKASMLGSQETSTLAQSAYQGLAQIQASMLGRAKGAAPRATTPGSTKALRDRIEEDKRSLEATRTKARKEVEDLVKYRDKQGSEREVQDAEAIFIKDSIELFEAIAEASKNLLANFYQAGEEELKAAGITCPCKYAIMGLGSVALQQTTPYSDLEFAILMEDAPKEATAEAWRAYFRKLTHLVHFRVINMGETVLPFSEYKISLDHLGKKGLNFDLGGKTPLGRKDKDYELIQPVEGMMEYLKNEGNKMEQMDKLLPFVLERTCYIYGDQKLHDNYLAAQKAFWSSCQDAAGKHAYQERMMKVLLKGMTELDHSQPGVVKAGRKQAGNLRLVGPKLHPDDAGRLYDVKQEIYRLPDRLLYGLAFYYGILPESAWDAVDKLLAGGKINAEAARHLKYMASFAVMLRLDTYLHHGQQNEQLSLRGSLSQGASGEGSSQAMDELLMLSPAALQEDGSLFRYYYTALPLYQQMEEFFEMLNLRQEVRKNAVVDERLQEVLFSIEGKYAAPQEGAYFQSEPFYDTSCAVKVSVYNRLQQYKSAKECAAKHHEEAKARYFYNTKKLARYHHNLAIACYNAGSFDESKDHFTRSLEFLEGVYPKGHAEVSYMLKIQRNKGIYHYNRGEYNSSRQCFAESLQLLQAFYNDNHPETAQMLLSLGEVDEALGNFEESLQHKADALKMLQSLYTAHHPAKARALLSLGDAYTAMGQLKTSRDHKQDALKMFKELYGRSHPQVARALLSLGDVHAALENFEASLQHKQEALAMLQALYGSSHPEVARVLLSLGETYAAMGQLEKSIKLKDQSWKMLQFFYREDHPEVVRALGSLNETREAKERFTQDAENSRQDTGHALRPLRTAHPQHLALLPTPRHGKEPAGENTKLRAYYKAPSFSTMPSLFEEGASKPVSSMQCQLMLFEQKRIQEDKQGMLGPRADHVATQHEFLAWVPTSIDLKDLFKKRSIKPGAPAQAINKVLVTGDPGTGKTTLSRKLAYEWSVGNWGQEFDAIYVLPVKKLQQSEYDGPGYDRKKTLATAIVNICFANDLPTEEPAYNRLREHIKEELQKPTTLVILDGLDERAGTSEQILNEAKENKAGKHKLLILSRPYGIDQGKDLADIQIKHAGFNEEQMKAYVLAELQERADLAKELLDYIQAHENIRSIAHVPVNLQILCTLWQDDSPGVRAATQQGSLPGLYRQFVDHIWKRYVKARALPDRNALKVELFDTLGQIALAALEQRKELIDALLVDEVLDRAELDGDLKTKLKDAGFLLLQLVDQKSAKAKYEFPHLTFQEYFAGRWLAGQFLAGDEDGRVYEFIATHKYEARYARALSFLSGEVLQQVSKKGKQQQHQVLEDLLNFIAKEPCAVDSLEHTLCQLRIIHEWLCISKDSAGIVDGVEEKFGVVSSLKECLATGLRQLRSNEEQATGRQLLTRLSDGLASARTMVSHIPLLFGHLFMAATDDKIHARLSGVQAVGKLWPNLLEDPSPIVAMLQKLPQDSGDGQMYGPITRISLAL